jgi:flagellar hook-length control protein FliK
VPAQAAGSATDPSVAAAAAPADAAAGVPPIQVADVQAGRVAAPATPAAPPPAPARPVLLHELPGAVGSTIRLAVQGGETEARLTLHPADLGQVQIRIHYGVDGVSAQIAADSMQAVQALRDSAVELRRALESQGIVVRDLDVSTSGSGRSQGDGDAASRRQGAPRSSFPLADDETETAAATAAPRSVLGLVDVLA